MPMQPDETIFKMSPMVSPGDDPEDSDGVVFIDDDGDEFEVTIVDDRPVADQVEPRNEDQNANDDDFDADLTGDEQKSAGPRVTKRIGRLRYEYHEQRRAREAAERMQQEAVRFAQQQQGENERLRSLVSRGEEVMLSEVRSRTKSDLGNAEILYEAALEEGSPSKILAAQKALSLAQIEQYQVDMYNPVAQQNYNKAPEQPIQQYIPQQQTYNPSEDARLSGWMEKNDWFQRDAPMTDHAMKIHRELTEIHGINPMSDEYYQRLDRRLQTDYPHFFENRKQNGKSNNQSGSAESVRGEKTASAAPSVVAPTTSRTATSAGKSKSRRQVQLTATQKALARNLKITPEQYARELVKMEQKNG
jgi:hypothetical protein